ncbi:MAG: hypothetical protein SPF38_00945 [Dysosmobacter sp.]|nr:hypothetical protein [Dysosmobacter sp.]
MEQSAVRPDDIAFIFGGNRISGIYDNEKRQGCGKSPKTLNYCHLRGKINKLSHVRMTGYEHPFVSHRAASRHDG